MEAIDARAAEARKAFLLRMNAQLTVVQDEHSAACDANLARWREAPEADEERATAEFDREAARLLALANERLDALQRESEREHARIAREREAALAALAEPGAASRFSQRLVEKKKKKR